jgi:hypothetical protein
MCWTAPVAFGFALWQWASAAYLWRIGYVYRARFCAVLLVYGAMEMIEALGWLAMEAEAGQCGPLNRATTVAAYVLLCVQPVANMLACWLGTTQQERDRYELPLMFAIVAMLISLVNLAQGEWNAGPVLGDHLAGTIFGTETCTHKGPNGYILWQFRVQVTSLSPLFFMHLCSGLAMMRVSPARHRVFGVLMYFGLALCSYLYLQTAEFAAFWCLSTAVLPFFGLADHVWGTVAECSKNK